MKPVLNIVGAGVASPDQMTLVGLKTILASEKVLSLAHSRRVMDKFYADNGVEKSKIFFLDHHYLPGEIDVLIYENLFAAVQERLVPDGETSLVLAGHPRIAVTLTSLLEKRLGLEIEINIIEGISSFATMINDLKLDPLERGIEVLDANRMILFDHKINCLTDKLIYHVCSVGNSISDVKDPTRGNQLNDLKEFLLKYYPTDHEFLLVKSACDPGRKSINIKGRLKDLDKLNQEITVASSLYIKGKKPNSYNKTFYRKIAV